MEPTPTEEIKNSEIQRFVMDRIAERVKSSRDFQDQTGISHAMYGRYLEQNSMMSLDKLEKIFSTWPDLRGSLISYLRGTTDEKPTPDGKNMDIEKLQEAVIEKDAVIRFLDNEKTKIQRKLDDALLEIENLKKENQALRERLDKAGAVDKGKK